MTHPRLLNTRVRIAGAASIATLSLLFTPLSPLYGSVAADNSSETTQAAQTSDTGSENATTEEASGASADETRLRQQIPKPPQRFQHRTQE